MATSKPASTVFKHFAILSSNIDGCFKAAYKLCGTVIYSTTSVKPHEYTCILITFSISNCNVFEIHFLDQVFVFAIVFSDTAVFVLATNSV